MPGRQGLLEGLLPALHGQQPLFEGKAAAKAAKAPVGADHAVTGDDDSHRIGCHGRAHRPGSARTADGLGDLLVAARLAAGDGPGGLPHGQLEGRAPKVQYNIVKRDGVAAGIRLQTAGQIGEEGGSSVGSSLANCATRS